MDIIVAMEHTSMVTTAINQYIEVIIMKNATIILVSALAFIFSISVQASHSVSGYYCNNGTYVAPHMSMDPGEARSSGYSYHDNELTPNGY